MTTEDKFISELFKKTPDNAKLKKLAGKLGAEVGAIEKRASDSLKRKPDGIGLGGKFIIIPLLYEPLDKEQYND